MVRQSGLPESMVAPPGRYKNPALSGDGRYLAVEHYHDSMGEIRVFDLVTKGGPTRIAPAVTVANPIWGPDGRLAYVASQTGWMDIYTTTADNPTAPVALVTSESNKMPTDWSPDGQYVGYVDLPPGGTFDVWVKPVGGSRPPVAVATTDAQEAAATFSRDGQLLAYLSTKSGRPEIYVQSFPGRRRPESVHGRRLRACWGSGREFCLPGSSRAADEGECAVAGSDQRVPARAADQGNTPGSSAQSLSAPDRY